jgi:hypothetical protein
MSEMSKCRCGDQGVDWKVIGGEEPEGFRGTGMGVGGGVEMRGGCGYNTCTIPLMNLYTSMYQA